MKNRKLFDAITDFAVQYGRVKWNDDENIAAYKELVDMCIKAGKIPECNRNEPSTHGALSAAITYVDNRMRFCEER